MYEQQAGRLEVGATRSDGRAVTEWKFRSPLTKGNIPELSVHVSIHNEKGHVHFRAHGACLGEAIRDTDIERLRAEVEERLRRQHDLLTGLVWEDWLEVEVTGSSDTNPHWNSRETRLTIIYRPLKRAVDPATGEAFTINSNGYASSFPKPKTAGLDDDGNLPDKDGWSRGRNVQSEFSYLRATPENIAALDALIARADELRRRLSEFLAQDQVEASLTDVAAARPRIRPPL